MYNYLKNRAIYRTIKAIVFGKTIFYIVLLCFMFVSFFFMAGFSEAEIYKWTDKNGTTHFTDDYSKIPGGFKEKHEKTQTFEPAKKKSLPKSQKPEWTDRNRAEDLQDPSLRAILAKRKEVQDQENAIYDKCKRNNKNKGKDAFDKCYCSFVPQFAKSNSIWVNALLDLIKKRPELKNKKVKISTFWTMELDPQDLKQMSNPNVLKVLYDCK